MKVIGVFGNMNSGKDTAAGALTDYRDYATQSLAAPMKAFAQQLMGFTVDQLYGPSESRNAVDPRWGVSPRHMLQTMGTDWMRNMVHEDVWINFALDQLSEWRWEGAVIPDARYENEVRRIREFGGYVVKVTRPGAIRSSYMDHASEKDQFRIPDSFFDLVIVNDGTVDELREKILEFENTVKDVEERR